MKLVVIGTGYVGLVTGACFAEMGNTVTCFDIDEKKIANLKENVIPIYEPGLESLVFNNQAQGLLNFTTSLEEIPDDVNIFFIAVGTPSGEDGSADLRYVLEVARNIGGFIKNYSVVVNKSTVPVGTADLVKNEIQKELDKRGAFVEFDVVSNPEFLKEGDAIQDFIKPDRVIVGTDSERALKVIKKLYTPFSKNREKVIFMGVRDAEMTKYTANAMLATKISFMNEIANICDRLEVDVENVRKGIGSDSRIGYSFIYPGCGYGGSCFPKDVRALIDTSKKNNFSPWILKAVVERNEEQKMYLIKRIEDYFGSDLSGKKFCIWGLSFKPGTDDMREAPSLSIINALFGMGGSVNVYDPVFSESEKGVRKIQESCSLNVNFSSGFNSMNTSFNLSITPYEALIDVDALILVTEWKIFRQPDFKLMKKIMKGKVVFDGRNQYDPEEVRENGFDYYGVGR